MAENINKIKIPKVLRTKLVEKPPEIKYKVLKKIKLISSNY